jgi:hypothetical protein
LPAAASSWKEKPAAFSLGVQQSAAFITWAGEPAASSPGQRTISSGDISIQGKASPEGLHECVTVINDQLPNMA